MAGIAKTVLVTGASGGIGGAIARRFAQGGYRVALHYHTGKGQAEQLAGQLRENYSVDAQAFGADIADPVQVQAMVEEVTGSFGRIDLLVNNAGVAKQQLFTDMAPQEWEHIWSVNVSGMIFACQAVLPQMIRRKSGKIVNLSSIWGITGASCEVAYSATKAAIIGLTKALAQEVGPSGITVNCVAPGVIATRMNAALSPETIAALKEETPLGVIGTPEDVAHAVFFLASPEAGFITGQVLSPNGGFVI